MTPNRRDWSSDLYWRISVGIMIGMAFAVIWFGPRFVIAAHPAELRPWPSLGTIFEAVGDALSEPQRRPETPASGSKGSQSRPSPSTAFSGRRLCG